MAKLMDLSNVVELQLERSDHDYDPARLLQRAIEEHDFSSVIIIGRTVEGKLYFGTSMHDMADVVWEIEKTKHWIFTRGDED